MRYHRRRRRRNLSSTARQLIFWVLILVGAVMLYTFVVNKQGKDAQQWPYSQLVEQIKNGKVEELTIKQTEAVGVAEGKTPFHADIEGDAMRNALASLATGRDANGQPIGDGQPLVKGKVTIVPAASGAF